jgi:CubicO group peptidase (beta-lactamase class C family)
MALEALQAKPEAVGLDKAHLRHAHALLENGVQNRVFPCATYRILRHGMIAAQGAVGVAQPQANIPLTASLETIFDLASISKTFTATLLLQHLEEGRFSLGQKVADFLSEAEKSPSAKLTLRQLATHTSGLPPWKALYKTTRPSALAEILETPLAKEPGTHYAYSDLGYILLGEILARVSKKTLDTLVQERICAPKLLCAPQWRRPQTALFAKAKPS